MAKFQFKFNTLKKYKENLEKITQKEIAEIDLEIRKVKLEIKSNIQQKNDVKEEILSRTKIRGSDLKYLEDFSNFIDASVKKLKNDLLKLSDKRKKKVEELVQRTKEKKIVDRIEEIHKEDFNIEQNRLEQIQIDELASIRYTRKEK